MPTQQGWGMGPMGPGLAPGFSLQTSERCPGFGNRMSVSPVHALPSRGQCKIIIKPGGKRAADPQPGRGPRDKPLELTHLPVAPVAAPLALQGAGWGAGSSGGEGARHLSHTPFGS